MPSILVLEQEPGSMERIHQVLGAEGWKVRIVWEPIQALQAASAETPDLVIASAAVAGAETLAGSFSRRAGGPGLLGLQPVGAGRLAADETLAEPFSDQDLRDAVRRALAARPGAAAPKPRAPEQKLTSLDIFGDVLAEVESAGDDGVPAPQPPAPAPPRPAAPPPPAGDDDVNRRLEKTLSGVFGPDLKPRPQPPAPAPAPPAPAAAPPPAPKPAPLPVAAKPVAPAPPRSKPDLGSDDELDAILSKTLSSLDMGTRPKAPSPPRPAPAAPPVPSPAAGAPAESTAVRKAPKMDFDLAELEELGRTRRPKEPTETAIPRTQPAAPVPAPVPAVPKPAPAPPAPAAPVAAAPAPPPPIEIEPPRPAAPVSVVAPMDAMATQRIPIVSAEPEGGRPGEPFGQYTLLEKIAVGGMAEVWKARMRGVEGFQKMVAIKKILPHMSDNSEFIGMFIDEAKLAAQLSHPNIVHIYDLGKIGRSYYIAMEYVEGKDLRSILNAGRRRGMPLPIGLSLLIAARVANALDYAHRKRDFEGRELSLVHRDVSPQNVLISNEGDVKLCDFGIAKAVSKAGQTQMGALKGKLQYMSPEQAWGKAVDARSDIFSLGAVLFEMLTGERLFSGESEMSVLESVRQGHTRSPREVDPSLPAEVDEIVTRALAHEVPNRFQSAAEMSQRLEALLHGLRPTPGPADLAAYLQRIAEPEVEVEADSAHFLLEPPGGPAFPTVAPAAAPAAPSIETGEEPVAAVAPVGEVRVEETGKKGRGLLYAAIVVLLLAILLTLFFLNRRSSAPPPAEPPPASPSAAPSPGAGAAAPTPTPAQAVDVNGLIGQEISKKEEELRRKYEAQQKELEKQIAAAEKSGKPVPGQPTPAVSPSTPSPAPAVSPEPSPPPAAVSEEPPPAPQREPDPEPPPRAQEKPAPPPAPVPEAPKVQTGDLVAGGPGVSPPALVSAPKPKYPPQARVLRVEGVVVVSVLVDENGRVQDARLLEPIAQKVGINEEALSVARNAQYRPATKDGVRVKMWTRLRIPFKM
jgi:TonB family protein